MSIAAAVLATASFAAPEVSHFPGSYFDSEARWSLQRRAMEKWPGPSQIIEHWRNGDLRPRERSAILLGMSASHDLALLPLYREAVTSPNGRVRMAAAYGYRDLLGDALPDLSKGLDPKMAEQLGREMDVITETLRHRPLVEFWLQAVLMNEGLSMPGWQGAVLRRPSSTGLRAIDEIVIADDFRFLAVAFRLSEQKSTRLGLMRLIEAITLQEFLAIPIGDRAGWGSKDIDEALELADFFVDQWLDRRCTTDPNAIMSGTLESMGVHGLQVMEPKAYDFWLQMLKRGRPAWRVMAARRLYELGGRWAHPSIFQVDSERDTETLDELVKWYRLLPDHVLNH